MYKHDLKELGQVYIDVMLGAHIMSQQIQDRRLMQVVTYIPRSWIPIIQKYMEEHGYWSVSELLRDLLRKHVVEASTERRSS